jgi:hypothetical protein
MATKTHVLTACKIAVPNQATATTALKAGVPARAGSKRSKRWLLLVTLNGQTVAQYYAAARNAGLACSANNPIMAMQKGLVTLTQPNGQPFTASAQYKAYMAKLAAKAKRPAAK